MVLRYTKQTRKRTIEREREREREEKKYEKRTTTNVFKVIAKFDKIMNVDNDDDDSLIWCVCV